MVHIVYFQTNKEVIIKVVIGNDFVVVRGIEVFSMDFHIGLKEAIRKSTCAMVDDYFILV